MSNYDQSQTFRLGQTTGGDNTLVIICDASTMPEAPWHGMLIYRTDTQVLQIYRAALQGGNDAFEDITGGIYGRLTFVGDTEPEASGVNDLWFDTDDENHLYYWDGADWVSLRDQAIAVAAANAAQAISDAADAQSAADAALAVADGATVTYYQAAFPWADGSGQPSGREGDLFFDTDDKTVWRWSHGTQTWVQIKDPEITEALNDAAAAQAAADGKITAFYQATVPTVDVKEGDLWFDTDTDRTVYYAASDGANEIAPGEWQVVNPDLSEGELEPLVVGALNAADLTTLHAIFGTPGAQRVEIDGSDPSIKLYNAANQQTGNFDGVVNFLQGSMATDAPGNPRVEIGRGPSLLDPAQEVRFYTGHADEIDHGSIRVSAQEAGLPGNLETVGIIEITTPQTVGALPAILSMSSASDDLFDSTVSIHATKIDLNGKVDVDSMGGGTVGNGGFRDSVDGRVDVRIAADTTKRNNRFASNTQTGTTYTPVLADAYKIIQANSNTSFQLTIPPNVFAADDWFEVYARGTAIPSVVPGAGVVINAKGLGGAITTLNFSQRHGLIRFWQRAANNWVATGDIGTVA